MKVLRVAFTLIASVTVLTGCSSGHEDAVTDVAEHYFAALADGDGQAACDLLAPGTRSELEQNAKAPCPETLLDEAVARPGDRGEVSVFGTMAEVHYAEDTVFLAEFDDGWRVMASGCKERPGRPYDCSVKGG